MFREVHYTPRYIEGLSLPPPSLLYLSESSDELPSKAAKPFIPARIQQELALSLKRRTPLALRSLLPYLDQTHVSTLITFGLLLEAFTANYGAEVRSHDYGVALVDIIAEYQYFANVVSQLLDDGVEITRKAGRLSNAIRVKKGVKEATVGYFVKKAIYSARWATARGGMLRLEAELEASKNNVLLALVDEHTPSHPLLDKLLLSISILSALTETLESIWLSETPTKWDNLSKDPTSRRQFESSWGELLGTLIPLGRTMREESLSLARMMCRERWFDRAMFDAVRVQFETPLDWDGEAHEEQP
ncbi:hypothetical protein P7C70_g6465, partial [Phenoliferia sp. Uapishka_3]